MSLSTKSGAALPAWQIWTGRVLSGLLVVSLFVSASFKLVHNAKFLEGWAASGYAPSTATPIALAEITSAVLYAVPKTRVLGAILMTGYLGGAVSTHVRMGQSFLAPLAFGIIAWGALVLRDARLRTLLPLVTED